MATLANGHFTDSDINGSSSAAVAAWTSTGQARAVAHPEDYAHLNGELVDVVDDGVVGTDQTVANGTLPNMPTGTYHIGLNYVTTIKPMRLDIEGMGLVLTKKVTKGIISFYNTLKCKFGPSTDKLETVSFDTALYSGIKEVPINDGYDRDGDIIIKQDEPLPMTCRGLVLDAGVYDK